VTAVGVVAVGFIGSVPSQAAPAVPMPPVGALHLNALLRTAHPWSSQAHVPSPPPPWIAAAAAELVNVTTGRELFGREQNVVRSIASLTKVMTALVVINSGHLNRRIMITWADENYLGCCIQGAGLIPGDILTARQLLYAMLLPSGADAALALATSFGPGVPAFVQKMNQTAHDLHMYRSHFSGFDGVLPSNVSTPGNLLTMGEAAMSQASFRAVVGRASYQLLATRSHHYYFWRNRNQLLGNYQGADGIKTGWIPAAGECLLFEAVRGTRTLIGVVLDSASNDQSPQSFYDAEALLNWGFEPRT
jgi:D-alanyl-D-alanine carboxypeptidase (penicillin-binding protein 5/6)